MSEDLVCQYRNLFICLDQIEDRIKYYDQNVSLGLETSSLTKLEIAMSRIKSKRNDILLLINNKEKHEYDKNALLSIRRVKE